MYEQYYQTRKKAALKLYTERPLIYSAFFKDYIFLGSEGFRHLSISATGERSREEQVQRFTALRLAIYILETATKLRSYRKRFVAPASGNHLSPRRTKVQWWKFTKFFRSEGVRVHVVVRKVGNGKIHFWSVMLNTNGMSPPPNLASLASQWE